MINIYFWTLFIFICLLILFPIFGLFIQINDEKDKAGKASYLTSLSILLIALIPLVGNLILPINTLIISIRIYTIIIIILNSILMFMYYNKNKHFFYSTLLVCITSLLPYALEGHITRTETIDFLAVFDLNFPMVLFSFWLPLLAIVIIASILLKKKETVNYFNGPVATNEKKRPGEFDDILIRMSIENLSEKIISYNEKLQNQLNEFTIILNHLRTNEALKRNRNSTVQQVNNNSIQQLTEEIHLLQSKLSPIKVNEITVTNQVLIKELTHFIATPLATIETSCKLVNEMISIKEKKTKLQEYINRIESSINICKGILATYREIFIITKSEDKLSLSELINESFDILNDKNLKLNLKVLDTHDKLSNYYIISTLFPLMSNAITAATKNSTIEIIEDNNIIKLSNEYQGNIDLTNLDIEGYSSKPNHKGMGLYTVRHLLARRNMGPLVFYKKDNHIIFEIPIYNEKQ